MTKERRSNYKQPPHLLMKYQEKFITRYVYAKLVAAIVVAVAVVILISIWQ